MMSGLSSSPRLIRAGIVLMAPDTGAVIRTIALQYAPETLMRQVTAQTIQDGQNRSQAVRLTGPATETISLDAVMDATDQLEFADRNPDAATLGVFPALAALETMLYPSSAQLERQNAQAAAGSFEITPAETPLALFVWSAQRIVPIRLESLQITEEFFDARLNPIRAKLSLSMKVLSVNDLGFSHRGSGLFMAYLQAKEQLAARSVAGSLDALGAGGLG